MARTRGRDVEFAAPKSDAYTGLLAISLGAMIIGCLMLYLDYSTYPTQKPPQAPSPTVVVPASASAVPPTPPATPPATPPTTPPANSPMG
jgi:hypothetical protein